MAPILENAEEGINKTELKESINLSDGHFNSYLGFLSERGLLKRGGKVGEILKTTSKGMNFLKFYRNIEKIIKQSSREAIPIS
jgi:predicted transcriptional regulator